jgi:two-component system, OmpR family, response regulator
MRILLAEDDRFLADGIAMALRDSGYSVDAVTGGTEADLAVGITDYDLLILDLGLPRMDGIEVLKRIRGRGLSLPVLIITARDTVHDRVLGLDLGANDYLTKPFHLPELEARIRALVRKEQWRNQTEITYGELIFDTVGRTAHVRGQQLELSAREIAVLELMLQRTGRVVSKANIIEHMSSWETDLTHNALDIIMHRLRKKLEDSEAGIEIKTLRGLGYLIERA